MATTTFDWHGAIHGAEKAKADDRAKTSSILFNPRASPTIESGNFQKIFSPRTRSRTHHIYGSAALGRREDA
jgi:hypothetical protein